MIKFIKLMIEQKRSISSIDSVQKKQKINASTSIALQIASKANDQDLKTWTPSALPGVGAPAKYQQRVRFIDALIKAYQDNNIIQPKRKAVQKELEIASKSSNITYGPNMKICIRDAKLNKVKKVDNKELTRKEMYERVRSLIHPITKLERSDYVTEIPETTNNETNLICNRCQQNFQLSEIKNKTKCQFHERKKIFNNNNKYWACCDQVVGETQGCKTANYHVFKAKDGKSLHDLIPFVKTPKSDKKGTTILGLDCEMGYTTKGLELIRLTVLDFYTGTSLFDKIIKPYGEILDLNTQWSGVAEIPEDSLTLDELHQVILGSLIDEDTIIVGHGLENDLNSMRLVHHNVVDTSILYPKGLNNKFALKDLSFKLLDRNIQTGEHSSEEDSLAAIDIVKAHICK